MKLPTPPRPGIPVIEPRPICIICSDEIPGLDAASICGGCFGIYHVEEACSDGDNRCAACITPCDVCTGPVRLLGILGKVQWHRCRDCGIEFMVRNGRAK